MIRVVGRTIAIIDKVITVLAGMAAFLVVADAVLVSAEVIARRFFGVSHAGLFELTEYSLLWITFLGTAWVLKNEGHVRVDLILNRLHPKPKAITNLFTSCACILLSGFLVWYSVNLTLRDYQTGFVLGSVLRPLKWPIEIIIPIGYFLLFVQLILKSYGHIMIWKSLSKQQQAQSGSLHGGER